ncbi:DUF1697 domain-containing protein [Erythrobacter sp. LQ02-29]|uniref:DUF1697 domain-containing protein n=1 Tax=Erythrobacter sp. LQ02-29 TaxID=2920384 RepID=UPI001F4DEAC4|nr:DUF1697 domain-containing protein [Erythrobacter sp. LQ02-29]
MTRYAALLGSINVGGNQLKMAELRAALADRGFANVATVIASGNVLFDHAPATDAELAARIADVVKNDFGIESLVVVRTANELRAAIDDNPFVGENEDRFVHTHFVPEPLDRPAFEAFVAAYDGPERVAVGDRAFFVDYRGGVGDSKLHQKMRPLGLRNTARNVGSLQRILDKMTG